MKLEEFLRDHGVGYEKHTHPVTYTSQGLANVEHVSGYLVAKPVIVKAGPDFVMCVLAAPKHLDLKRVADVLHQPNVRLAAEAEMADLFPDCELGAQPPVGPLFGLKTIMDRQLLDDESLVMQAGRHTEAITIRREDWQRLCNPEIASIAAG